MASRMLRVALQPTPEAVMPVLRHESLPGHFMSTFLLTATNPITIVAFLGIFAFFGIGAFGLSNAMAAWLVAGVFAGSSIWWLSLAGLAGAYRQRLGNEIGRASCRERVCQNVYISVVAVLVKKKITYKEIQN